MAKTKNNNLGKFLSQGSVVIIFLLVIIIFAILTGGKNVTGSNLLNIFSQASATGLITIGMTFVVIDQGIDLSVGGIACLTSAVGCTLMVMGVPWILCVLVFLGLGVLIGFVNGIVIAKLKITPFICTLAMMQITQGLACFILGGKTVFGLPDAHTIFGQANFVSIPVSIWILAAMTIIASLVLKYTSFGREVYAQGGNPTAAWTAGVNVTRNRVFVYMISGLLSAIAALVISSRVMCAQMTIGEGSELDAIAGAVLGGVRMSGGEGRVWGAIIGAVIMVMINNGLNLLAVSPFLQKAVKGLVILVAVIFDSIQKSRFAKMSTGTA